MVQISICLDIHIIFHSPHSTPQCSEPMLRETSITLVDGVHIIILFVKGPIRLVVLTVLNNFPMMHKDRSKVASSLTRFPMPVYIASLIYLIVLVMLLQNENNLGGML